MERSNKLLYTLELFLRMIHTNSTKLLTHTLSLSLSVEGRSSVRQFDCYLLVFWGQPPQHKNEKTKEDQYIYMSFD